MPTATTRWQPPGTTPCARCQEASATLCGQRHDEDQENRPRLGAAADRGPAGPGGTAARFGGVAGPGDELRSQSQQPADAHLRAGPGGIATADPGGRALLHWLRAGV